MKIAYGQAGETYKGEFLHMTVHPESWWEDVFSTHFKWTKSEIGYIVCHKL